ncbi:hypothetical protein [Mycolicibacterium confluentis]|uniref:Uncharacterized protein n=1 Tax=Mycolicibacterium confluentis TaxID=28047 RepID=A0A7I7XVE7_9MYCO|nr:hypothetical protein [Mycolicibacterium confluentis]MCV7322283.1 hypothetical protein [Mycolicibacterium confluentis]ORV28395.1 hypothetical protein AWB99_17830 [Mycolicibacterium confluentis]BBZ33033.1 hypothetical protein MCNF_16380 [Mycolicibacterium confluentis]
MARSVLVLSVAFVAALAGLSAGTAHAGPPPPCTFTLSAPQVVPDGSGSVVTATVSPDACGPPAEPAMSVACLEAGGMTTCAPHRGPGEAHISTPYVAGSTYVATGRGCGAWIGQLVAPDCQLLGPLSLTP